MAEMFMMVGIIGECIVYLAGKKILAVIKARRVHFIHHIFYYYILALIIIQMQFA